MSRKQVYRIMVLAALAAFTVACGQPPRAESGSPQAALHQR